MATSYILELRMFLHTPHWWLCMCLPLPTAKLELLFHCNTEHPLHERKPPCISDCTGSMWIMIYSDLSRFLCYPILYNPIPCYLSAHTHITHIWNVIYSQPAGNGAIADIYGGINKCWLTLHILQLRPWSRRCGWYWWMTPLFQHVQPMRNTEFI